MSRSFLDLQNEVLLDEFDATKYRSLIKNWMNEAAQHISREVQLPQLEQSLTFTQGAGVASYTLPTDIQVLTSVVDSGRHRRLFEVDINDIDDSSPSVGAPTVFAIYGGTLTFYPTPSASTSFTVRYEGGLSDLSGTSDGVALPFPDDFLDLLVSYARARAFAMEDDFEASSFYQARFDTGLSRMRNQVQLRTRGRVRQIQGQVMENFRPRFRLP